METPFNTVEFQSGALADFIQMGTVGCELTLFPNETKTQVLGVNVPKSEIDAAISNIVFIMPSVFAAVGYTFAGSPVKFYTPFAFDIARSSNARPISTAKKRSPSGIFPDEGDVPKSEVRFRMALSRIVAT